MHSPRNSLQLFTRRPVHTTDRRTDRSKTTSRGWTTRRSEHTLPSTTTNWTTSTCLDCNYWCPTTSHYTGMLMHPNRIAVALIALFALSSAYQCRNEVNEPVDWWIIFKMRHGGEYIYTDGESSPHVSIQIDYFSFKIYLEVNEKTSIHRTAQNIRSALISCSTVNLT